MATLYITFYVLTVTRELIEWQPEIFDWAQKADKD